ncbi:MAG: biopolymer transporter ExbD [Gemmatimonadaceae bacterium]|nr:biopolymer transporter ExbD [Gemmatimonadaceae bacterium]
MASLFRRSNQRRAERAPVTAHGNINLVPLVDILTSIVFFSLLTYQGAAMMALTSFDLALPPVVVNTPEQASHVKSEKDVLNLLLAVRVDNEKMIVEHSGGGGFRTQITGLGPASLDQLQALMTQIRAQYPQNSDVLVIPSDDVSYDNIIHVLERLKLARFVGISLGTRARGGAAAGR